MVGFVTIAKMLSVIKLGTVQMVKNCDWLIVIFASNITFVPAFFFFFCQNLGQLYN